MPQFSTFDYKMMSHAITLAKKGMYTTAPNPNVGCVIVSEGQMVGEGFHKRAGEPHAEVHALRMAGSQSVGATAYVTLEPCSHYGRTPPCAEGLINAGVSRVVCAMQDPNPQVAGRGIEMLRQAGILVDVGLLESEAEALNPAFIKRMKTGRPFVQLKMAASLDGQTALSNGVSQWITSPQSRQNVQAYRAKSCAILSTSKTVIEDNASLNVRWDDLPSSIQSHYPANEVRQPARVILDRQRQLSASLNLYQSSGAVITVSETGDIVASLNQSGQIDLDKAFQDLVESHNINNIWVEAGATLAKSLINADLVDELILYLAPKIMGSDGRGLFGALGFESMSDTHELSIQDLRQVGPDIRIVATLKQKDK
ncbi:bifunctional diaminohydroxyphosphoribosylaminopyrimidine deaminase/5-amino-6-(5-phosphoribosylamino)uracil reductase RibD [Vibrio genomosp. F10]|uniref:Riboflavin biosynthesis protein RibD n=1 Tax=Vibrio genomosp. F10 TaxID=723171 RepID=A0A1B9QZS1_9VIBR|nr:bifunctional diaminohydroxyphosphoribosylaminopyrimidine deaminase/5-amino-6-(5-phosphoribosylamino)uracil reductase RibD [Vibrio genomosp. F10]OCH76191.1 riboflavin biosynthesis protein RibD [Vibrio genomosp. F10]